MALCRERFSAPWCYRHAPKITTSPSPPLVVVVPHRNGPTPCPTHLMHCRRVLAGEIASTAPQVALLRPTCGLAEVLQVSQDAAPSRVIQVAAGGAVPQLSQHPAAGGWGVEDGPDVVLDRDHGVDVPDADSSAVRRASLLRRCPALRRTPPLGSSGSMRPRLWDHPTAARARTDSAAISRHWCCSSPSVQVITVAARQRRCFPIRIPFGP